MFSQYVKLLYNKAAIYDAGKGRKSNTKNWNVNVHEFKSDDKDDVYNVNWKTISVGIVEQLCYIWRSEWRMGRGNNRPLRELIVMVCMAGKMCRRYDT